mgnify:CR=1 FL=1
MTPEEQLRHMATVYEYEPDTGIFRHRKTGRIRTPYIGKMGPFISNAKHINGVRHDCNVTAGRLAWFIVTGRIPGFVRYKNGDNTDHRFSNLKHVTPERAIANLKKHDQDVPQWMLDFAKRLKNQDQDR